MALGYNLCLLTRTRLYESDDAKTSRSHPLFTPYLPLCSKSALICRHSARSPSGGILAAQRAG